MAKEKQETRFSAELLDDELLDGQDLATVMRSDGLVGDLKKALAERMLDAEMDVHLGGQIEQEVGNHRNGSIRKTVLSDDDELVLSIPRDRHGRFDPALIRKYQRRFPGFDDLRGTTGRAVRHSEPLLKPGLVELPVNISSFNGARDCVFASSCAALLTAVVPPVRPDPNNVATHDAVQNFRRQNHWIVPKLSIGITICALL